MSSLSLKLLHAYRSTRYMVDGVSIRIGRRSPVIDAMLRRHGARVGVLVTAWNPMSRKMPPGWNARMQDRLLERLRRLAILPADGTWRRWHEAHVLVFADLARVVRVARLFRQRAVVVVRIDQIARLSCRNGECSRL